MARLGARREDHLCLPKPFNELFAFGRGAKEGFLRPGKSSSGAGADSARGGHSRSTIGSVDYTTVLGSTISARMRGVPLVITGVFADKPMDFLVGAKGITPPRELKGKSSVSALSGTATHFLTARFRAVGLDPEKDVTLRAVGDEGLRLQALGSGLIQASLLGSQGVIQGEREGGIKRGQGMRRGGEGSR